MRATILSVCCKWEYLVIHFWMSRSDLLEKVHAQVGGEVGDGLSTEAGQRNLRERLGAQRFSLFIFPHVLQNTAEQTDDITVSMKDLFHELHPGER